MTGAATKPGTGPASASEDLGARLRDLAARHFGHDELLPGQEETMRAVVSGRDVLLVSPTGSGKSLPYQVAGLALGGCTLVVSPLLALQADQVAALEEAGVEGVARLSSAESESDRAEVLDRARRGELRFLFLAPEQLTDPEVRDALAAAAPVLVAVDEAHCVSAWGHDFRPDYFRLGELLEQVGSPTTVAMTATAAAPVREDVVERLGLDDPLTIVTGFARDNIALSVVRATDPEHQRRLVLDLVAERAANAAGSPGLLYCRTRKGAEEYAEALAEADEPLRTAVYHGGLSRTRRDAAHEAFQAGEVDLVVATSAFGMGIDRADVRFVVHADVPESPDTYYQEVGRAGRDGEPAQAVLVYRPEDLSLGRFFSTTVPRVPDVEAVVAAVAAADGSTEPRRVAEHCDFGPRKAGRILNLLRLAEETGDGSTRLVNSAVERAEAQRRLEESRVEMMRTYAETERCRAVFLTGYFGEASDVCGHCDNCRAGLVEEAAANGNGAAAGEGAPYRLDGRVRHAEFGVGTVTDLEEDRLTVLFEEVGYRTLSTEHVQAEGLLEET